MHIFLPIPPPSPCMTFDDSTGPLGDLSIRSCDDVLFRVSKSLLSRASTVFANMFSLPYPSASALKEEDVVSVTEHSSILAKFLDSTRPGAHTAFSTISDISSFYCIADKYCSDGAMEVARKALVCRAEQHPVDVYLAACHLGLESEARTAARCALKRSLDDLKEQNRKHVEERGTVALERLWTYHERCQTVVKSVTDCDYWALHDLKIYPSVIFDPRIPPPPSVFSFSNHCCTVSRTTTNSELEEYHVKAWFLPFLRSLSEVLALKPSGEELSFTEWSGLFADGVAQAKLCSRCGCHAFDILRIYNKNAMLRVASLISTVELDFTPF